MTLTQEMLDKSTESRALALSCDLYVRIQNDRMMPTAKKSEAIGAAGLLIQLLQGQDPQESDLRPTNKYAASDYVHYTDCLVPIHAAIRAMQGIPTATRRNLTATMASLQATLWHVPCN